MIINVIFIYHKMYTVVGPERLQRIMMNVASRLPSEAGQIFSRYGQGAGKKHWITLDRHDKLVAQIPDSEFTCKKQLHCKETC